MSPVFVQLCAVCSVELEMWCFERSQVDRGHPCERGRWRLTVRVSNGSCRLLQGLVRSRASWELSSIVVAARTLGGLGVTGVWSLCLSCSSDLPLLLFVCPLVSLLSALGLTSARQTTNTSPCLMSAALQDQMWLRLSARGFISLKEHKNKSLVLQLLQ